MKAIPSVPAGGAVSRGDAETLREQWLAAFRRRDHAGAAAIRRRLFVGGWSLGTKPPYPLRPRSVRPLSEVRPDATELEEGGER